jgi:hypothetical protein
MGNAYARMEVLRNAYRILVGKPQEKIPRPRWVDPREIGWDGYGLDPSGAGYGPVEGSCEHDNEP